MRTTSSVPGWLWPLVAGVALVIGVLGGALGGLAVSSSLLGTREPPVFETAPVPAPLEPDNGSVAAVAAQLLPSTVQIIARSSPGSEEGATGSGFVSDRNGHIITNNHVVEGAADGGEISVVDQFGERHDAEILGRSPVYDIAVLKVEGAGKLRPASLGSSRRMNVGETVVAIGSPLGLSSTVTSGIISALNRPVTTGPDMKASFINAVQTDAAINPGNSGGPLVNLQGQVVGVNSAIATTGGPLSGSGNIGVGFAIPMEQVSITARQILETGRARYPIIGANVDTARRGSGADITGVPAGSPADDAGLRRGDVVVAVDGLKVLDGTALIVAIRTHQPGEVVELKVRRGSREVTVRVTLASKVG